MEKVKKLPIRSVDYLNTFITGMVANNILYSSSARFHSVQVGIDIPLFGRNQNTRIKALKVQE